MLPDDLAQGAQLAGADDPRRLDVVRLPVDAVADQEPAVRLPAGVDHLPALGRGRGHRLLAQHVLPRLCGAHGVLGVQRGGEDDVDGVDGRVVAQPVVGLVAVDAPLGQPVGGGDRAGLVAVAADERGEPQVPGAGEARKDLVDRVVAEPDHRDAEPPLGRVAERALEPGHRAADGGRCRAWSVGRGGRSGRNGRACRRLAGRSGEGEGHQPRAGRRHERAAGHPPLGIRVHRRCTSS